MLRLDFSAKVILDLQPGPQNDTLQGSFQKLHKKMNLIIITEKNTQVPLLLISQFFFWRGEGGRGWDL